MPKTAVHVKLTAQPGKGGELLDAFAGLYQGPLDAEAGTELHIIHQAKDNPDVVLFYELYSDDDALKVHSSSEALHAVYPKLAGLMAGQAEMTVSKVVNAKGVAV